MACPAAALRSIRPEGQRPAAAPLEITMAPYAVDSPQ